MNKTILAGGTLLGVIAIIIGAFGAHAIKPHLDIATMVTFETGVKYQMYHALFLLFIGSYSGISNSIKKIIFYLVIVGVIFFSGSIYGLATTTITSINFKSIAFVTPIGGALLITAWLVLLTGIFRQKQLN